MKKEKRAEVWKDIEGFETLYQVSNTGKVRSLDRVVEGKLGSKRTIFGKELAANKDSKGYPIVQLFKDGKRLIRKVHRLVAMGFIPNPENKPEVNHKDGKKGNNNDWNLEWTTTQENIVHRDANGLGNTSIASAARMRKVEQYSLTTGALVATFDSAKIAATAMGTDKNDAVARVCRGERGSFMGFGWRWAEGKAVSK